MKIALLGYGKMGKTIERIALERGHQIVLKVDSPDSYDITQAEVAIEFSTPQSAFKNISEALSNGVPTVAGTTGWLEKYEDAVALCKKYNTAFLYASNFSIGVNIFFEINKKLAQLMKRHPEYAVSIEEIHHTQKLDAPSGTAIVLAQEIIANSNKLDWELTSSLQKKEEIDENKIIPITARRIENIPGVHTVTYQSVVDTLEIKHTAHNRVGFAFGAVLAAEWIVGKKGIFSMKDVLFEK